MSMSNTATEHAATQVTIDVRFIPPRDRHALIFDRFDTIQAGEALQIVNDHDPQGLHRQFAEYLPGKFDWSYLESGPDLWRVRIAKVAVAERQDVPAGSSCCSGGACCG